MAQASSSTPPKKVDWKRKLNLDRTNAKRASNIGATPGTNNAAMKAQGAPRFRDLMENAGAPEQEEEDNGAIPMDGAAPSNSTGGGDLPQGPAADGGATASGEQQGGEAKPAADAPATTDQQANDNKTTPNGGKPDTATGEPKLKSAQEVLGENKAGAGDAAKSKSGLPTGLEGKDAAKAGPTPPNNTAAQIGAAGGGKPIDSMARNPNTPKVKGGSTDSPDKQLKEQEKKKAKEQKQDMRKLMMGKDQSKILNKMAKEQGKSGTGTTAGKSKLAGAAKMLKRIAKPPGTITGKIGTLIRIILTFVGGMVIVDVADNIIGEELTDKMLTMNLLVSLAQNCCSCMLPFLPLLILAGLLAKFMG